MWAGGGEQHSSTELEDVTVVGKADGQPPEGELTLVWEVTNQAIKSGSHRLRVPKRKLFSVSARPLLLSPHLTREAAT